MYAYDANAGEEEYYEDYDDSENEQEGRYEVVTASRSYVEPFKHINLEGRLIWPGRSYFRALDEDWQRMKQENGILKECLARSGNAYMLSDANKWMTAYTELKMENANLKAQLEEERAMHRIETMELRHRADFFEHRYNELAQAQVRPATGRDKKSGQFRSSDGMPLEKKQDRALEMYEKHISYAEIGRVLGLSAGTVEIYVRKARDRRAHQKALENFEQAKKRQAGD